MRGSNRSSMNLSMIMTADNNGVQVSHDILKVFFSTSDDDEFIRIMHEVLRGSLLNSLDSDELVVKGMQSRLFGDDKSYSAVLFIA